MTRDLGPSGLDFQGEAQFLNPKPCQHVLSLRNGLAASLQHLYLLWHESSQYNTFVFEGEGATRKPESLNPE